MNIQRDQEIRRLKGMYRAAYDFHHEALGKQGTVPRADFWRWFFDRAAHILDEHNDDRQTMQDFIVMIHSHCEALENRITDDDHQQKEGDEEQ